MVDESNTGRSLRPASLDQLKLWAKGKVTGYRSFGNHLQPVKDGLFDPEIFGAEGEACECGCGELVGEEGRGQTCPCAAVWSADSARRGVADSVPSTWPNRSSTPGSFVERRTVAARLRYCSTSPRRNSKI